MSQKQIRVRFAPSPTGELHIGNVRTALFNWLWARKHNGRLILRIEDTDLERSKKKWETSIINDLNWLGLDWDEGPDRAGAFGPYRQSERLGIYREVAQRLVIHEQAYYCYCTKVELTQRRKQQLADGHAPKYDGRCRELSAKERSAYEARGIKPGLRFKIAGNNIEFSDLIRGKLVFDLASFGDFVIMRSDGWPTYNFAGVIDDSLMNISHIIRGEDHIPNTPKQLLIYQALGHNPPYFAHLPLILDMDNKPLSKRNWYTSVHNYRQAGFLPQSLINYLALLGWSPRGAEIMGPDELKNKFSLADIGRSPAIFDIKKAGWINSQYIRELGVAELTELCLPYLKKDARFKNTLAAADTEWLKQVIKAIQPELNTLDEVTKHAAFYLYDSIEPVLEKENPDISPEAIEVIKLLAEKLNRLEQLTGENVKHIINQLQSETGAKGKNLYMPIRLAMTGHQHGPELLEFMPAMGKKRCWQRLHQMLNWLQVRV
jgi:nondiscriminating glutamyl-tRNA synthetase